MREWILVNAERGDETGAIIPGQVLLLPDGETVCIVSVKNDIQLIHCCIGCWHANKSSSMKQHKRNCPRGGLGTSASTANNCIILTESLSHLRRPPGTQTHMRTSEVKKWMETNGIGDRLGQFLCPFEDKRSIIIVRSPDDVIKIFQYCLDCGACQASSSFDEHTCKEETTSGGNLALAAGHGNTSGGGVTIDVGDGDTGTLDID